MVFESKKIIIASAKFNIFVIICFASLAAHCSEKYYAVKKVVNEQNKTVSGKIGYEKVSIL